METPDLAVIIPARNEAGNIGPCLVSIREALDHAKVTEADIITVDSTYDSPVAWSWSSHIRHAIIVDQKRERMRPPDRECPSDGDGVVNRLVTGLEQFLPVVGYQLRSAGNLRPVFPRI